MEFPKIITVPDLGKTPARVNRFTGTVFLNGKIWNKLEQYQQKLILLHELGHWRKNTKNEIEADSFAVDNFYGTEKQSLIKSVKNFYNTLDMTNENHVERYNKITEKVLKLDFYENKNFILRKELEKMNDNKLMDLFVQFLTDNKLKKISELTETEKAELYIKFLDTKPAQDLMVEAIKSTESYIQDDLDYTDEFLGGAVKGAIKGVVDTTTKVILPAVNDVTNKMVGKGAKMLGIKNPAVINGMKMLVNPANILTGGVKGSDARNLQVQNQLEAARLEQMQIENAKKGLTKPNMIEGGTAKPFFPAQKPPVQQTQQTQQTQNVATEEIKMGTQNTASEPKKSNKKLFIIGGAVLAVVIVVAVIFITRKK